MPVAHVEKPAGITLIRTASPAPREAWEEALRADPLALETQSPAWADAMCEGGGFVDASRLYETDEGRVLVLPVLGRALVGRAVGIEGSNPPHCGVGGLLAAGGANSAEIAAVFGELSRRRVLGQSLYPNPLLASAWAAGAPGRAIAIPRRAHILDLDGGFERVWSSRFSSSTRTGVRKAEREGVGVECDTSGRLVPDFYKLLEREVPRWARIQHEPVWLARRRLEHRDPLKKFEAIARALGRRCRVWLARVDGRPAAAFVFLLGANAYGYRAAMDEELRRHHANDLLVRLAIEDACAAGCRYYYMGESGWSSSRAVFKERLGGRPLRFAEYRLERLPITRAERGLKGLVKRALRFQD
jgi:CelD/BcsL family acetyltransferase involved in cellulose biosynthesis